ncbi:hypothetical protein NDU88_007857 [Pleurodeles waltl]|uniref:Uncharacterized protein n=1 Tax=Pleurodeles waltl TaxID=8319 RepID=A0AAV7NXQ4_PLEWA|nr:hypothetical protein NDU88_007857 [Pleurodeles waltl]
MSQETSRHLHWCFHLRDPAEPRRKALRLFSRSQETAATLPTSELTGPGGTAGFMSLGLRGLSMRYRSEEAAQEEVTAVSSQARPMRAAA